MYIIPFYFHIWKNSPYIQLGLVNITKKSVFRLPISDYIIFFSKLLLTMAWNCNIYGSWACKRSMCVNYLKNPLKTLPFFLQNCIFLWLTFVNMRLKLKNKKKFRQRLFGNYYSSLNYLSNDIQYVIFF